MNRILKGLAGLGAQHFGRKLEAFFAQKKKCSCKWYCEHRKYMTIEERRAYIQKCRRG